MAIEKGSAFLLKVSTGATPAQFVVVAGLRTTACSFTNDPVNITHKGSGGWRELLSGGGMRALSISASGVFTNSAAEARLRTLMLAGQAEDCQLVAESSETLAGRFIITRLDYAGDFNGERSYAVTLESSGAVTVLP